MSAIDKLRGFAEAREHDWSVVRDGLTHRDCRELIAEIEALRADAERYRWLRDVGNEYWIALCNRAAIRLRRNLDVVHGATEVDRAIDAARGK